MVSNPNVIRPDGKTPVSKDLISKILRNVTEQEGFRFYTAIGEPTGITAISLTDFVEKLGDVDVRSVNFHYPRKDFEKWILDVIGDAELASRLNTISRMHVGIKGEALRNQIIRIAKVRLSEIKPSPPATSKPPVFGAPSATGIKKRTFLAAPVRRQSDAVRYTSVLCKELYQKTFCSLIYCHLKG